MRLKGINSFFDSRFIHFEHKIDKELGCGGSLDGFGGGRKMLRGVSVVGCLGTGLAPLTMGEYMISR